MKMLKFLLLIVCLLYTSNALADNVTLAWDPSPDPITSYTVFYAEQSVLTNPSTPKSAGKALQLTIPNLTPTHTYYFAVKAYYYNNESGFSNELVYKVPTAGSTTSSILTTTTSIITTSIPTTSSTSTSTSSIPTTTSSSSIKTTTSTSTSTILTTSSTSSILTTSTTSSMPTTSSTSTSTTTSIPTTISTTSTSTSTIPTTSSILTTTSSCPCSTSSTSTTSVPIIITTIATTTSTSVMPIDPTFLSEVTRFSVSVSGKDTFDVTLTKAISKNTRLVIALGTTATSPSVSKISDVGLNTYSMNTYRDAISSQSSLIRMFSANIATALASGSKITIKLNAKPTSSMVWWGAVFNVSDTVYDTQSNFSGTGSTFKAGATPTAPSIAIGMIIMNGSVLSESNWNITTGIEGLAMQYVPPRTYYAYKQIPAGANYWTGTFGGTSVIWAEIWVAYRSVTTSTTTSIIFDSDGDGVLDNVDNCVNLYNPLQLDADGDGIGDCCDPTPGCGALNQPACDTSCY